MLATCLAFLSVTQPMPELPAVPREFRAAWVATVDNIDWPSRRDLSADAQKSEMLAILDKAAELRLNAIIFQIRPACDALYASEIEPWSEYLTGQQGRAPAPFYDPLKFAIDEAHRRGLELHVWFNPYRAKHPSAKAPLAESHIASRNPELVRTYGNMLWLDPGMPEVRKRSERVMLDVVRRYDIDGVHIDDYFYPYPLAGQPFPDDASYAAYQRGGGMLGRDDWRRKNVDDFVREVYEGIKRTKRHVKFGISPFGIYRPGIPTGIKAGVDQYAQLYADCFKWLQEGWCDYMTPQLYWPIKQTAQSYPVLLDWWVKSNPKGRHIWPGNFTSRTNPADGNWLAQEVVDQIKLTRTSAGGNVHFSMKALLRDWNGVATALKNGPYREAALPPATPWLDSGSPDKPLLRKSDDNFSWREGGREGARWWVVWTNRGQGWRVNVLPPSERTANLSGVRGLAVAAVDRSGNISKPIFWRAQ